MENFTYLNYILGYKYNIGNHLGRKRKHSRKTRDKIYFLISTISLRLESFPFVTVLGSGMEKSGSGINIPDPRHLRASIAVNKSKKS